jgi:hypothetical protein
MEWFARRWYHLLAGKLARNLTEPFLAPGPGKE